MTEMMPELLQTNDKAVDATVYLHSLSQLTYKDAIEVPRLHPSGSKVEEGKASLSKLNPKERILDVPASKRDDVQQERDKSNANEGDPLFTKSGGAAKDLPSYNLPNHGSRHRIKFGDNSITTDLQADTPIYLLPPVIGPSNYLSSFQYHLSSHIHQNDQHELIIESRIAPAGLGLPSSVLNRTVLENNAQPLEEAATIFCTPKWIGDIGDRVIDKSLLTPFLIGNHIDSFLIAKVLGPQLECDNVNLLSVAAVELLNYIRYQDNSGMYAKLIFWATILDLMSETDQAPAFNEFTADDNTITYINLADAKADPFVLRDEIVKGSIIFRQRDDYHGENDLQNVLWLARSGMRVSAAAENRTPDACYTKWPAINVCILGYEAAPSSWPSAAARTSEDLLSFARHLAFKRFEQYDLCRGIYYAMDLMGTRFRSLDNVNYRLSISLDPLQPRLPHPVDYHFMYRLLGIHPPFDADRSKECDSWMRVGSCGRIHLTTFYVASIQTFTTTYLYSLSVCTSDLEHYFGGQGVISMVPNLYFRSRDIEESLIHAVPKRAMCHYTGFTIEQNLYTAYHCIYSELEAAKFYKAHEMDNDASPRYGSCLCIDNFLLLRPQEWAVLGPNTSVDFSSDLSRHKSTWGLYSCGGDKTYNARVCGNQPNLVVPYGVQMLNIFSQFFEMEDFDPNYVAGDWDGLGDDGFGSMVNRFGRTPAAYGSHHFLTDLHIFEPCTLRTFDLNNKKVRAPVIVAPEMTILRARCIRSWKTSQLPDIGFHLNRVESEGMRLKGVRSRIQNRMLSYKS